MRSLLVVLIVALTPTFQASANGIPQLEKTLEYYKNTYPKFLDVTFKRYISQFMFMRYFDYVTATTSLVEQAKMHSVIIDQMQRNWIETASSIDTAFDLEDKGIVFHALLGMAARETLTVKQIKADLELLRSSYAERCSEQSLKYSFEFFEPRNLFRIDQYSVSTSLPSAVVSVPISFAGEVQGVYASHQNQQYEAMLRASRYAGEQTIGGYKGQMIGAFIGAALVEIFNNIEIRKQEDLQNQINQAMADAVGSKSIHAKADIKNTCEELLPANLLSFLDSILNNEDQLTALITKAEQINSKFQLEFELFPKVILNAFDKINQLLDQAALKVELEYERIQSENSELQAKNDSEMRSFLTNELVPVAKKLGRDDISVLEATQIKKTLWNLLLNGEARFGKDNILWSSIADVMQREIEK